MGVEIAPPRWTAARLHPSDPVNSDAPPARRAFSPVFDSEDVLLTVLLDALDRRIHRTQQSQADSPRTDLTIFHAVEAPSISLRDYLRRLLKYTRCSRPCFISALLSLDCAAHTNPRFALDALNVHRLLVTSVMVAAKFWDDTFFASSYYARVGGIPTAELNALELEFLMQGDFCVSFSADRIVDFQEQLLHETAATKMASRRLPVEPRYVPCREALTG